MAGSTTKTTNKKTASTTTTPEPEAIVEDNSALSGELQAAQKEIAALKGQVAALTPAPEPEPEPLTIDEKVQLLEAQVGVIVDTLRECFSPGGYAIKVRSRLDDRLPR